MPRHKQRSNGQLNGSTPLPPQRRSPSPAPGLPHIAVDAQSPDTISTADIDLGHQVLTELNAGHAPQWQGGATTAHGAHPQYGGLNWGVRYSEHWDDFSVNHAYYGTLDERDGAIYVDGSAVPLHGSEVRWTCDQRTRKAAEIVWQHREFITHELRSRGFAGMRGVRVRAVVSSNEILVEPYDRASDFSSFVIPRHDR